LNPQTPQHAIKFGLPLLDLCCGQRYRSRLFYFVIPGMSYKADLLDLSGFGVVVMVRAEDFYTLPGWPPSLPVVAWIPFGLRPSKIRRTWTAARRTQPQKAT
jgi:hypothetical protein